ncbi:DUF4232 domain-containing protein [Streptomyces sp. NPDC046197]|uniref:DUF4232 domain-containing protein n=1 Tax=Streptomyces sp. NPDC046197 TaxID=3154337 RepID=UPI0033EB5AD1
MQYGNGIRRALMAMVAVSAAAVSVTACQPGDAGAGAASSSPSAPGAAASSATGAPDSVSSQPSRAQQPSKPHATASHASGSSHGSGSSGATLKACGASGLNASARQAADRPEGTGTGAAVVEFTNVSGKPCLLQGHPSVAGAANGSPQHSVPLQVTPKGSALPVRLAPGGKAWVKLTFVQVQGEADGYCKSGSKPVVYPTLVVGLPGSGAHQVALDDGQFAECDNKVTVTAVSAVKPS